MLHMRRRCHESAPHEYHAAAAAGNAAAAAAAAGNAAAAAAAAGNAAAAAAAAAATLSGNLLWQCDFVS